MAPWQSNMCHHNNIMGPRITKWTTNDWANKINRGCSGSHQWKTYCFLNLFVISDICQVLHILIHLQKVHLGIINRNISQLISYNNVVSHFSKFLCSSLAHTSFTIRAIFFFLTLYYNIWACIQLLGRFIQNYNSFNSIGQILDVKIQQKITG